MNGNNREINLFADYGLLARLGILFGLFFIMLMANSFISASISIFKLDERTEALTVSAIQSIFVFIIPSLIYARCVSSKPAVVLDLNRRPYLTAIGGIIVIYLIGLPFLNQVIYWNGAVTFPASLKSIESIFHDMEDRAMEWTEILLSSTSVGGLISGILIIGVLTGFAEELFFRGSLQNIMVRRGINPHLSIWCAAFIFSFLHFQFFGFVPRLLLGAFFGYLLYWTDSIWVSVTAHALNNSLVVVTSWLTRNEIISIDVESVGILERGFPWIALISLVLLTLVIGKYKDSLFKRE